jgi:hypothetical protein
LRGRQPSPHHRRRDAERRLERNRSHVARLLAQLGDDDQRVPSLVESMLQHEDGAHRGQSDQPHRHQGEQRATSNQHAQRAGVTPGRLRANHGRTYRIGAQTMVLQSAALAEPRSPEQGRAVQITVAGPCHLPSWR